MPRTPTVTRVARAETKNTSPGLGENVISALVAAGYKRTMAAEATWACDKTERASIGAWTAAALRRCAPGGVS
jgi:Holliday junction resolvasome RuvABC DNA-binding subunit